MNQLIINILNKIDNDSLLSNQLSFQNNHIFDDLAEYFKDNIQRDDLMAMFYYMNTLEKSLSQYRRGDINLGNLSFNKLLALESSFKEPVQNGMLSLHSALISYKNYVHKDYDLALIEVDKAIHFASEQSKTFPYFIIAIGEQWLNKNRIFIKTRNVDKLFEETTLLNQFLLYGICENDMVKEKIEKVPQEHRHQMLNHVINSIDLGLRREFLNSDDIVNFYKELSRKVLSIGEVETKDTIIEMSYKIINCLNSQDSNEFMNFINENYIVISKSPKALQRIIIEEFIKICDEFEYEISLHSNYDYFVSMTKKLGINFAQELV
jgi:hypothetical protein